jgi:hypothetical protein
VTLESSNQPWDSGSACGTVNILGVEGKWIYVMSQSLEADESTGLTAQFLLHDNGSRVTLAEMKTYIIGLPETLPSPPGVLDRIRANEITLSEVVAMVREGDASTREEALSALDRLGSDVAPIVPELLQLLAAEEDHNIRYSLVLVVANIKHSDLPVVEVLSRILHFDDSGFVRRRAAREFWEMGVNDVPIPAVARDALREALRSDSDAGVRIEAAKALGSNSSFLDLNRADLERCSERETANFSGCVVVSLSENTTDAELGQLGTFDLVIREGLLTKSLLQLPARPVSLTPPRPEGEGLWLFLG